MDSRQIYVHQSHIGFLLLIQRMKLMDKRRLSLKISLSICKITGRRFKERKVTFIVELRKSYQTNSRDFWWALLQKLERRHWGDELVVQFGTSTRLPNALSFAHLFPQMILIFMGKETRNKTRKHNCSLACGPLKGQKCT